MSGMELRLGEAWPSFGEYEEVFISFKPFSLPMAIHPCMSCCRGKGGNESVTLLVLGNNTSTLDLILYCFTGLGGLLHCKQPFVSHSLNYSWKCLLTF